jgi:DNA-binding GntR family transcriptional regulator
MRPNVRARPEPPLAEIAYMRLKRWIIDLTLRPGMRFSEADMVRRLGIGKTPVREGLRRLVEEGFLQSLPYVGYEVSYITLGDVEELFGWRLIIEPAAAGLAVGRVDVEELERLEEDCQRTYLLGTPDGVTEYLACNRRIHMLIAEATSNRWLAHAISASLDAGERFYHIGIRLGTEMPHNHAALIEAFRRGDAAGAQQISASQISSVRRAVIDALLRTESVRTATLDIAGAL